MFDKRLATMICETCLNMFQGDLWLQIDVDLPENEYPRQRICHATEDGLRQAAREHCQICTLIWRAVLDNEARAPQRGSSFTQYRFRDIVQFCSFFWARKIVSTTETHCYIYVCGTSLFIKVSCSVFD